MREACSGELYRHTERDVQVSCTGTERDVQETVQAQREMFRRLYRHRERCSGVCKGSERDVQESFIVQAQRGVFRRAVKAQRGIFRRAVQAQREGCSELLYRHREEC